MAQVIRKPQTKEPMAAWHIGSTFEKNATFAYGHHYLIVQDGKIIGSTIGTIGKKQVKLNKKFFKNLKCSLFSKKVKADIYAFANGFYGSQLGTRIDGFFPPKTREQYRIVASFSSYYVIDDIEKVYRTFIQKPGAYFYTIENMVNVFREISKMELERIAPTFTCPKTTYYLMEYNKESKDPGVHEIFNKYKEAMVRQYKEMGYKLSINLGK